MVKRVYDYLSIRKRGAAIGVILTLALSMALFLSADIRADIRTMFPEGNNGELTRDYNLLTKSSLTDNVFITVQAEDDNSRQALIKAADDLAAQLSPPYFEMVNPASINPVKALRYLLQNASHLVSEAELAAFQNKTTPETITDTLQTARRQLSSPQGLITKQFIRIDPIGIRTILAPRLEQLNAFSDATIMDGHLFSKDDTAILLTARSAIPMGDADGSNQLLTIFNDACRTLPGNITADIISGHVHTAANASTIKRDLLIITVIAAVALSLLFVMFFRTRQALGIVLAPGIAMCCALGGLAVFHETISAIVIGFGAVLIGISIDFAMHVYFAIARHQGNAGLAVQAVTRPILFCALTSCAAFGALFLSGIPGIRQLALFAIVGLIASLLFSLCILPLMSKSAVPRQTLTLTTVRHTHPKTALAVWLCAVILCGWFGSSISIDPDLRNIGYRSDSIQKTERHFANLWGDMRSRGIIFVQGESLESALSRNDAVHTALLSNLPDQKSASIAPLLPSVASQRTSQKRWHDFWTSNKGQQTVSTLDEVGEALGYSQSAFHPFKSSVLSPAPDITPDALDKASLGLIREMFILDSFDTSTIATYVPDSKQVRAFFSPEKEQELGVHLVSNTRFKTLLESAMKEDIKYFITISGAAVIILALLLFRDIRRSCLALLPAATGIAAVFGVLGATHTDLNLFHITALPLIIGLGADYGIFIVSKESQLLDVSTIPAVIVSGLTTLAGFGVLAFARHPSLNSMGITVLAGISAALICALFIMPHFLRRQS